MIVECGQMKRGLTVPISTIQTCGPKIREKMMKITHF